MRPLLDDDDITVFVISDIKYPNLFFKAMYYFICFIELCLVRKIYFWDVLYIFHFFRFLNVI